MADNYLEYARENYEKRKAEWLRKKKRRKPLPGPPLKREGERNIEKPEDEAL